MLLFLLLSLLLVVGPLFGIHFLVNFALSFPPCDKCLTNLVLGTHNCWCRSSVWKNKHWFVQLVIALVNPSYEHLVLVIGRCFAPPKLLFACCLWYFCFGGAYMFWHTHVSIIVEIALSYQCSLENPHGSNSESRSFERRIFL